MNCVQWFSAFQQLVIAATLTVGEPTSPPPPMVQDPPAASQVATSPGLGTLLPGWFWSFFG